MKNLLLVLCLAVACYGHTWLAVPTKRGGNNNEHCRADPGWSWSCPQNLRRVNGACDIPIICYGPCDRSKDRPDNIAPVTIQRGVTINLEWPRNNHAGGFIRIAWARTGESDSHYAFDQNVYQHTCHETGNGCQSGDPTNNPLGSDGPNVGPCKTYTEVPLHLSDGAWTMQHVWYGGDGAFGDYFSCKDYIISGGPTGAKQAPKFRADDYRSPGSGKCNVYSSNKLHTCQVEPCDQWSAISSFGPVIQLGVPDLSISRVYMWPTITPGDTSARISFESALGFENFKAYIVKVATDQAMTNVVWQTSIPSNGPSNTAVAERLTTISTTATGLTSGRTYYVKTTLQWSDLALSYFGGNVNNIHPNWQLPQSDVATFATTATPLPPPPPPTQPPPPPPSPPPPAQTGDTTQYGVIVTVTLPRQPVSVNLRSFTQNLAVVLGIPLSAIVEVTMNLDKSTDYVTVIHFKIVEVDGVDPVAASQKLQQLAQSNDPILTQNSLGGLQITSSELVEESAAVWMTISSILVALGVFLSI